MIPVSLATGRQGCAGRMSGWGAFLVCGPRGPCSGQTSAASDPADRQRRAAGARWRVRQALRGQRSAIDCAGAAAARVAAAGVLHIRSETQLMEQLNYNLLYRWFVGLGVDEPVWVRAAVGGGGCPQVPGRVVEPQGGAPGCCRTSSSRSTARRFRPGPR
jgi:hypothetical protein